jgi:hypothetical protein
MGSAIRFAIAPYELPEETKFMSSRKPFVAICVAAALTAATLPASAEWKYPDWSGQWTDLNTMRWDPSRPPNAGQAAPLTAEYRAQLEAAVANRKEGGRGNTTTITCGHSGMPRSMLVYETMEIVIKPNVTYVLFDFIDPLRRIYTDGRDWPREITPTWMGYSIGHWEAPNPGGTYDTLVVETRGFKGPRILDGSGIPFHKDNQTIITERISLDRTNSDVLLDEITLVDHAFTKPWTATRSYKRKRSPAWAEFDCRENNEHIFFGGEAYLLSADGYLMPTRKDQPPPDTRYFRTQEGRR